MRKLRSEPDQYDQVVQMLEGHATVIPIFANPRTHQLQQSAAPFEGPFSFGLCAVSPG